MINPRNVLQRSATMASAIFALALVTGSCDNDESLASGKGKMTFSFEMSGAAANGRAQQVVTPETVIVSVVDENGHAHEYIKLGILAFGSGYVSENLELATGHYRLTEFFVLDGRQKVIYCTPKEGSTLARFVIDPLDIAFDVHEDENTQVRPQVLGIEDAAKPGDFGYASFGFDPVNFTALILPETTEAIVKVSYEFNSTFRSYTGEGIPTHDGVIDLDNPKLINSIWRANINVWTEAKACHTQYSNTPYQKVYRLTTELTFTGAAFELPSLTSNRWDPYYYRCAEGGPCVLFSANPLKSYHVEIQAPEGLKANYCWIDRRFWNASGGETCDLGGEAYTYVSMDEMPVGRLRMKDQPVCETGSLQMVDSYVGMNTDKGAFREYFAWVIVDGVPVPSCGSSSSGRVAAAERRAPSVTK